jgi:hypothetical protein
MSLKGMCGAIVDKKNRWITSFIIGFGISLFLMNKCMYGRCIVVQGPPRERIHDRVFKVGDSCVTFHPEPTKCDVESVESV